MVLAYCCFWHCAMVRQHCLESVTLADVMSVASLAERTNEWLFHDYERFAWTCPCQGMWKHSRHRSRLLLQSQMMNTYSSNAAINANNPYQPINTSEGIPLAANVCSVPSTNLRNKHTTIWTTYLFDCWKWNKWKMLGPLLIYEKLL